MQHAVFSRRRDALRTRLRQEGLSALLVSQSANRYYLSGFELHNPQENESSGMVLVTVDGRDILYTDPRYRDSALRLWPEENLCIYRGNAPAAIAQSVGTHVCGSLGVEAQGISLTFYDHLIADLPGAVNVERTAGLVESLRQVKSTQELARIEAACAVNHAMMEWVPSILAPGMSEAAVAWEVEKFFREHGASELAFATIVGRGQNAALPHCVPCDDVLALDDMVLIDAGCRVQDYCSDQTRTFWLGNTPPRRFTETMAAVREAQRRAIAMIRPGVPCSEVYGAAWNSFCELGLEQGFTHGLGHGVGLETHEAPSLGKTCDTPLLPGMVVTVEPGLYDSMWGGIRWEYMVVVTDDGHRIL